LSFIELEFKSDVDVLVVHTVSRLLDFLRVKKP